MQHMIVQKVMANGAEVDLALLLACTYVETLDLSGPRLMMTWQDRDNIMRDDYGVVEGTVLLVSFSDEHIRGGLNTGESFVVRSAVTAGNDTLVVSCFVQIIHDAKTPAKLAIFMNDTDVPAVIKRAAPGAPVEAWMLPGVDVWHLLPGERPTKKLRMLAREVGAAIYYNRNKFHAKSLKELFAQPSFDTIHYGDQRETNQMVSYVGQYREELANERMSRVFTGWDMEEGVITGGGDGPPEVSRYNKTSILNALNIYTLPAIDFGINGWGALKPGVCVDLKFHRSKEGKPFDETLPPKVLLTTVAHHYATNRYTCRVKGGVVHG